MTQDLDRPKFNRQLLDDLEHVADDVDPLNQVQDSHKPVLVALCFPQQLITQTARRDLHHEPLWELLVAQVLLKHDDRHLRVVGRQLVLSHDLLDVRWRRSPDLQFELIASSKLVFDVLHAAEALENASLDHNAHLGGQSFSLFHRVSRQNNSTLLSLLSKACYNLPHKAAGLWVHA